MAAKGAIMAIFKQKGRNVYNVRIWVPSERRMRSITTGSDDIAVARQIEAELVAAAQHKRGHDRVVGFVERLVTSEKESHGMALSALPERYQTLPGRKAGPDTERRKIEYLRLWIDWHLEHYPQADSLESVTPSMVVAWVRAFRASRTGKTINNAKGAIHACLRALATVYATPNPFAVIPSADCDDSVEGRALTDTEVIRLLSAARGTQYEGPVLIGLYTGLRFSDIANLKWCHVKDGWFRLLPSKTRRHGTQVAIPIHQKVAEYLAGLPRESEYLFPVLRARLKSSVRKTEFSALLGKAGIKPGKGEYVSFHSLRHTFRTRLSRAAVRQEVAMKLGGWKTGAIAEVYNHDLDSLADAIARLP